MEGGQRSHGTEGPQLCAVARWRIARRDGDQIEAMPEQFGFKGFFQGMGPELETGPITIPRRLGSRRSLNVGQRGDLSYELRLDPMHEVNLRAAHGASPPRRSAPGPKLNSAPKA